MPTTVRLVCAAPVLRSGLRRALESAGLVEVDGDVAPDVTLVLVRSSQGISEIRAAAENDGAGPVVALADDIDTELMAAAVRAGAVSIVPWESDEEVLVGAVELAAAGVSTIDTTSLRWLVDHGHERATLTDTEVDWLAHLEAGLTISDLAPIAGYSERSLYRQLNGLYHRLGVHDRAAAIAEARRRGLL